MLEVCRRAADENLPIFLFGGTGEMLAAIEQRLVEKFTELRIAGRGQVPFGSSRRLSATKR